MPLSPERGFPRNCPRLPGTARCCWPHRLQRTGCSGDLPGLGAAWKPPARLCGSGGQPVPAGTWASPLRNWRTGSAKPLDEIVSDVVETLRPYEEKCGRKIPVFPAGGVYDGADIARLEKLGQRGRRLPPGSLPPRNATPHRPTSRPWWTPRKRTCGFIKSRWACRTGAVQSADPEGGGTGTDRSQPVPAVSAHLQPRRHAVLHHPGAH